MSLANRHGLQRRHADRLRAQEGDAVQAFEELLVAPRELRTSARLLGDGLDPDDEVRHPADELGPEAFGFDEVERLARDRDGVRVPSFRLQLQRVRLETVDPPAELGQSFLALLLDPEVPAPDGRGGMGHEPVRWFRRPRRR